HLSSDMSPVAQLPALDDSARRALQSEWLAAAAEAEQEGRHTEAAALTTAAVTEWADPGLEDKLERRYAERGSWRELAQAYRDRASRTHNAGRKAEILTSLAEIFEQRLSDPLSAARTYG